MMDKNVEQIIYCALMDLKEHYPKTASAVARNKCSITMVRIGNNYATMIDFTQRTDLRMSWEYFEDRSMELYDKFAKVEKWYST